MINHLPNLAIAGAAAAGKPGAVCRRAKDGRNMPAVRTASATRTREILMQFIVIVAVAGLGTFADAEAEQWHSEEWVFGAQAYLWGAGVETDFPDGRTTEAKFSDVVESLEMSAMVVLGATKGRWGVYADMIYLDVEDNPESAIGPGLELRSAGVKEWIINAMGEYEFARTDNLSFSVLGGLRYMWIEVPIKIRLSDPFPPGTRQTAPSTDYWDGVVGSRLMWNLNDKWYSTLHVDVGTGDTDLTVQAAASAAYRFDSLHAIFGYRYMNIDFDDGEPLDELTLKGPYVGVRFVF